MIRHESLPVTTRKGAGAMSAEAMIAAATFAGSLTDGRAGFWMPRLIAAGVPSYAAIGSGSRELVLDELVGQLLGGSEESVPGVVHEHVDDAQRREDGRFTFGVLTEAGRDKVIESTPAHHALIRRLIFDSLSPAQARSLGSLTRKISATIGPDAGWSPPRPAPPRAE